MRFAPKYPPNVRQAVARLRLDEDRSGPEIAAVLRAGEAAGCDPTDIPVATVYDIADRERNRRQAEIDARQSKTSEGQAAVTHRKLVEMAEQQRRRLEREAARNGGKLNLTELHKLASTIGNLNRGQPRPPASQALEGSNGTSAPPKPKQEQSDFQHQDHAEPRHQQD